MLGIFFPYLNFFALVRGYTPRTSFPRSLLVKELEELNIEKKISLPAAPYFIIIFIHKNKQKHITFNQNTRTHNMN